MERTESLNGLQNQWDPEKHCYIEGSGTTHFNGQPYQHKVEFLKMRREDSGKGFPTAQRAITQVAPDLEAPMHDLYVLNEGPGWGESTAQFEGDYLECLLEVLMELGYKNPNVIGVNTLGRGTPEYVQAENRKRISSIGFGESLDDAANLTATLRERGYFGDSSIFTPNIAVMGHSMGGLDAKVATSVLNNGAGEGRRRRAEDYPVNKLLALMPVSDGPLEMVRWRFVHAVRSQIATAVWQTLKGKGFMQLSEEEVAEIMFNNREFEDEKHYAGSVPDSATRFLGLATNLWRRYNGLWRQGGPGDGVEVMVARGEKDNIVPDNAIYSLPKYVNRKGLKGGAEVVNLSSFSHSIPFTLTPEQKVELKQVFREFFKRR